MLNNKERKSIAKDSDARIGSVNQIIEAGVPDDDVEGILELRETLTYYDYSKPKSQQIIAQPTIKAMTEAYHGTGEDLDNLEAVVEFAGSQISSRLSHLNPGILNAAIYNAVSRFQKGGLYALDEDDDEKDNDE